VEFIACTDHLCCGRLGGQAIEVVLLALAPLLLSAAFALSESEHPEDAGYVVAEAFLNGF